MKQCPVCRKLYADEENYCADDGTQVIPVVGASGVGPLIHNKYEIIAPLGKGGMGRVYKVRHRFLGEILALKVIHPVYADDPDFVKRFFREARIGRSLQHRYAVHVEDMGQAEDGTLYIVMEYVEGQSLRDVLKSTAGPLPVERALSIARRVAKALGAAHRLGILHRDVKPDNILLTADSQGNEYPKLADFGVASLRAGTAHHTTSPLFNFAYSAPEQFNLRGAELDGRVDLFSLGVTLFEMLTGYFPYPTDSPERLYKARFELPPPVPSQLNRALAAIPALDNLVGSLLSPDRNIRPPTADDLVAELEVTLTELCEAREPLAGSLLHDLREPRPRQRKAGDSSKATLEGQNIKLLRVLPREPGADDPAADGWLTRLKVQDADLSHPYISTDLRWLALYGPAKVAVFHAQTGELAFELTTLGDESFDVGCLAFTWDSKQLLIGGSSSRVAFVDLAAGKMTRRCRAFKDPLNISSIACSPDNGLVAVAAASSLRIVDCAFNSCYLEHSLADDVIPDSLRFSPDANWATFLHGRSPSLGLIDIGRMCISTVFVTTDE